MNQLPIILKVFGAPGTVALGVAVALAITSTALGINLYIAHADVRTAQAAQTVAEAQRDTEKKAAKNAGDSAAGWMTVANKRRDMLQACQDENTRVRDANVDAIDKARADAQDAANALKRFIDRYAADIRDPDCAAARQRLDDVCATTDY